MINNKVVAFLKLVRIENLIMIVLTQVMLRYLVLQKVLMQNGLLFEMNDGLFFLVILSTVLIAAGGYIINDYFDVRTDLINHPETVVVDKVIKRRWAIILHLTFTAAGLFIGVFAALKTGYLRLALFHVFAAVLLWFYSTDFKKSLLVGNFVVALLTGAVAFMPLMYELGVMQKIHPGFVISHPAVVLPSVKITTIFALFAFVTSIAREVIKDMEDYQGDAATGGRTLPIVWGIRAGRLFAFFTLLITAILLLFVLYNTIRAERVLMTVNNLYILLFLVFPLIALAFYVLRSRETSGFRRASLMLKLIMLAGLCYSFIYYFS